MDKILVVICRGYRSVNQISICLHMATEASKNSSTSAVKEQQQQQQQHRRVKMNMAASSTMAVSITQQYSEDQQSSPIESTPSGVILSSSTLKRRTRKASSRASNAFAGGILTTAAVGVPAIAASFLIDPAYGQSSSFTRTAACENEPSLTGYSSITDLNDDMQAELDAINNGTIVPSDTDPPYTFTICPGLTFDMRGPTPIVPVLNNVIINCGGPDSVNPECILDRSAQQMLIGDINTNIDGYGLQSITLNGITFNDFRRDTAVQITTTAAASPGATIILNDATFQVCYDKTQWRSVPCLMCYVAMKF